MSLIIRIAFVVLCAYAGTVVGAAQFSDLQGASKLRSEINN
ncbi:MAG: hypothetical protein QOH96_2690 [Blastocatellia bacterium]|jgi:hypothetical protein|nr:hypothetical protein [Blastocatellia bacterium]